MKFLKELSHDEGHYINRAGWLRAAVLGANDGIISTSSLVVGVAAASAGPQEVLIAGIAGMVAGAMSMAAGEYVSVSSQSDLEQADIRREKQELIDRPEDEIQELTNIYIKRGADPELARTIAIQFMEKDAIGIHAREELGISDLTAAQPLQAAIASAISFLAGALFPVLSVFFLPDAYFEIMVSAFCLILLGLLGAVAARVGGANPTIPALRVMFWGAMAMGFTALIGNLLGTALYG